MLGVGIGNVIEAALYVPLSTSGHASWLHVPPVCEQGESWISEWGGKTPADSSAQCNVAGSQRLTSNNPMKVRTRENTAEENLRRIEFVNAGPRSPNFPTVGQGVMREGRA